MSKSDHIRNEAPAKAPPKTGKAEGTSVVTLPVKAAGNRRASDKVIAFVKQHPVAVVAGGVAIGAVVSALLPRGASRRWFGRAVDLAEAAGATSLLLGREASNKAGELGNDALKSASVLGAKVEKVAGKASSAAADSLEKYGVAALAAAGSLASGAARKARQLGEATAEQSGRALHKAHELGGRITH